ncbi:MAG: Ig-like domain-containing protein, partial [Phototrophicaceae bacterium]
YWFNCFTGMYSDTSITANDDIRTVPGKFTSSFSVFGNDSSELGISGARLVTPATNGTSSISNLGIVTYTPNPTFVGRDQLTYRICNPAGNCDNANVIFNVYALPTPTVSSSSLTSTTCNAGGSLRVNVVYAGGPAFITVISGITSVQDITTSNLSLIGSRAFNIPVSSAGVVVGSNAFNVRVLYGSAANDGSFFEDDYWYDCNTGALINTTVRAMNDTATAPENFPITFDVVGNDQSVLPLDLSTFEFISAPTRGTVIDDGAGNVTYTYGSNSNFSGTDSFTYEICNIAGICGIATATVTIIDLADPIIQTFSITETTCDASGNLAITLIYSGGPAFVTAVSGITSVADLSSNDITTFGQQSINLEVSSAGAVVGGNAFNVQLFYGTSEGDATYFGGDFWYDCNTGALIDTTVTTGSDSANAPENFPITFDVVSNDRSNLPLDLSSLSIVSVPTRGTATDDGAGNVTYIYGSTSNFSGTDSFTYEICNVAGACGVATVTVTIIDLPEPIIENVSIQSITCDAGGSVAITVIYSGGSGVITAITGVTSTANISSSDIAVYGLSQTVELEISAADGGIIGDDVLVLTVLYGTAENDATYDSATYYFDCLTGEPVSPLVDAVEDYVPEAGRALTTEIDILANDTSRLPLVISTLNITEQPTTGLIELVDGKVLFTGDGFYEGEVDFIYEICNVAGFCDTAIVTVNLVNLYGVIPFRVCWIGNPNSNTSSWQITNANSVPMENAPEKKALYNWQVSLADEVLQSAIRWDNGGQVRVNTLLADRILVEWFVRENGEETGIIGRSAATATESNRCDSVNLGSNLNNSSLQNSTQVTTQDGAQPINQDGTQTTNTNNSADNSNPSTVGSSSAQSGSDEGVTPVDETPAENPPPSSNVPALSVCWIGNPNGNTSAWQVTNPNSGDVLYDWQVMSGDTVIQSGGGWNNTGTVRINTALAERISVQWYTDSSGTLGSAGASSGNPCS